MVYLQGHDFDTNDKSHSISFSKTISSFNSSKWRHAMEVEINSMYKNDICDLVELLTGYQPIRCK